MKYVRTKNKLYEEKYISYDEELNTWYYHGCYIDDGRAIKQADTIEELCDEFVVVDNNIENNEPYLDTRYQAETLLRSTNFIVVYGAIWTDKGLIYVAKMNERGELELL